MEIKATLQKPYTEAQKMNFVVAYNHQLGYTINETETELQALGYTQEELELQEKERISKLTCTKRVFALMLQELGITYTMLKELIATNEQAQLEWDLCVELERQNPLLDVMAMQLGITSEQLDGLFRYANGEITIDQFREMYIIPEPLVDNSEPAEEQEPVVEDIPDGEDVNNL
jgi:hypothetical protein